MPYLRHHGGIEELQATGMPLGLMSEAVYEEKETVLEVGDSVLFYMMASSRPMTRHARCSASQDCEDWSERILAVAL